MESVWEKYLLGCVMVNSSVILQDAQGICERVDLDPLRDATILVTGASGLIGTYVLACLCYLHQCGIRMQVYAQMLSEPPPHVSELVLMGDFKILRVNLAEFGEYGFLPESDVILHSAGYAQPAMFMANPFGTIQVNTSATIALLNRLRSNGKFLFASSSEVYSGLRKQNLKESDIGLTTPYHPRAAYIEGKRCGEAICNAFRLKGSTAISARLGYIYGPGTRKHDKRALNSFIESAICQGRIDLLDSGIAVRSYCYVADVVGLLWRILLYGREAVYNVGGHSIVTIAELAKIIGKLTDAEVFFPTTRAEIAGAPEEVRLDLTRVETEFGKNKYIGLEEGLRTTIEWQRGLYL